MPTPKRKRLAWRCESVAQQREKARIYNSRAWKQLRAEKLRANPMCERCAELGFDRAAHVVHHIVPIESATTSDEMWRLALGCGLGGLMSLCDQCHADIHRAAQSQTRTVHQQREAERLARWVARHQKREP